MSFAESGNYTASSLQPKFKDCKLDGGSTKTQLRSWIKLISSIVRNIPHCRDIESFLDSFLDRMSHKVNTRPSFLNDPRLQDDSQTLGSRDTAQGSTAGSPNQTESQVFEGLQLPTMQERSSASRSVENYNDLSEETKEMDLQLHSTLCTIVKGQYLDIVSSLEGPDARYSFAIIALWKHAALDDSTRRLNAMSSLEKLQFNNDGAKWKVDFIRAVREVYDSKLTLEHWIMNCAFKSFEGKNSQVQSMIANHINDDGMIRPGMNFDLLASEYSSFIATMNAGKNSKINFVDQEKTKRDREKNQKNKEEKSKKNCRICGEKGHLGTIQDKCPKFKDTKCSHCGGRHVKKLCKHLSLSAEEARKKVQGSQQKNNGDQGGQSGKANVAKEEGQISEAQIANLCGKLRSGEVKLILTVSPPPAHSVDSSVIESLCIRKTRLLLILL